MTTVSTTELDFAESFEVLTEHTPFPWQTKLFDEYLCHGKVPPSCSIPTGLGKTAVLAVWLIALARGVRVPRRLVYVVNRRTVVDQTTREAERLRDNAGKIGIADLAISTLRGQFADNREWSADPSRPAIICGTVDMIGSRLLFSGYGVGFKAKPLHAGFLGQDTLLVHDEAHLEPAFQKLLESIDAEQKRCGDLSPLRVMQLTATTRGGKGGEENASVGLTKEEANPPNMLPDQPTEPIHHVWRRLKAAKALMLHEAGDDKAVAADIARLALEHEDSGGAVLVFVRRLEDVGTVCSELEKKVDKDRIERLTGTMRGLERDRMADPRREGASRVFARFLRPPPANAPEGEHWSVEPMPGTVYLVCTSAGEVGIDLSADHMVCDLSTLDSMAQRLGRVNRYGERHDTQVDVVYPSSFATGDKNIGTVESARCATLELLKRLEGDGSPKALDELMASLSDEDREAAFSPEPTILPATDILFDAWALTSIREKLSGRPHVEPYLRGLRDWEPPETYVAWREEVERITDDLLTRYRPQDLLDDYPLKPHELLRDRSDRVFKHLETLAKRHADKPVWVVDDREAVEVTTLAKLTDKRRKNRINSCTILLPPSAGGLASGVLDGASDQASDIADEWRDEEQEQRRMRFRSDEPKPDGPQGMALVRTIDTDPDAEERESSDEDSELELTDNAAEMTSTMRGRYWHWYVRPRDVEDATRASTKPVTLDHHTRDVVQRTTEIVDALNLSEDLKQAIILAAKLHDLGKMREQWQRGIGNPNPTDWHAKSGKPDNGPRWRSQRLSDYRHEFGSLIDAKSDPEFKALSPKMPDLVLHLIAAHHGRARPHFTPNEACDPDHGEAVTLPIACETLRRFARLQRRYGRWGLAYLESILRAADWAASAEPSAYADEPEAKP